MAAPTTWTELKAELLADCMREDDEVLTARLPYFIGRAESHFQRELFSPEREAAATLSLTDGAADLPADFGGVKLVWADGAADTVIEQVTPGRLRELYPTDASGTPLHFAIEGETILLRPVPATSAVVKLAYIEGIPELGESQASNWLLADHPDVYVQASLYELYRFTEHFDKADRCRFERDALVASVNRTARRRKTNSGPLVASAGVRQMNRWCKA